MRLTNPKAWNVFAGGTCAAAGRHSYQFTVEGFGQYNIDPICWPNSSRHKGYLVRFANIFGRFPGGLWFDIKSDGTLTHVATLPATDLIAARRRCELHRKTNVLISQGVTNA